MVERSRRQLLVTGGALGVAGALAGAHPAWSWSPTGSVIGTGTGADPHYVWDAEADPVVAGIIERGETNAVNTKLKTWTKNGQALPSGLPADLVAFIENARKLPTWTDQNKLKTATAFNQKRGLYLGITYGFVSGMLSTMIPREALAVYYSKGGADMRDRITKTAKLGYDIGTANAFAPDGEMIVTCVKTRLAHAGVRHLLPKSSAWNNVADEEIPISQADMMVTWHSLPTSVMQNLLAWKVPIDPTESAGFLHSWQITAHMLGIRDEYIPATWADANAQAAQVLTPIIRATPEGIKLADILVNLAGFIDGSLLSKPILCALTRYFLGDKVADALKLPRSLFWDTAFEVAWPPFVAVREGLLSLEQAPGLLRQVYWAFDEILRLGILLILSGADFPIAIQIPTTNNPSYPG